MHPIATRRLARLLVPAAVAAGLAVAAGPAAADHHDTLKHAGKLKIALDAGAGR